MIKQIWRVYVVSCSDDTLYCGISTDVEKRVKTHNAGKGAKYTRPRTPVRLVWQWRVSSKSEALKLEHEIKKMSRKEKIRMIGGLWKSV